MSSQNTSYLGLRDWRGYEVGSDGTVWSYWIWGHTGFSEHPRRLKCHVHPKSGYLQVALYRNKRRHTLLVAPLITTAFHGYPPPGMVVRHFPDRDRTNNRTENVQWGTPLENMADRKVHGTNLRGTDIWAARLSEDDVRDIKFSKMPRRQLAQKYNIGVRHVFKIRRGELWDHIKEI